MTTRQDVRAVYDRIASHFSRTRPDPWDEVQDFLENRSGRVALDIGVGNGRHTELLATKCDRVLAIDLSRGALAVAVNRADEHEYVFDPIQSDAAQLPFNPNSVDLAVYIATLHHLPTRELRIASLNELNRVLSDGAAALISVWSVSHTRFDADAGFDTTVDWTLPTGETVPRYYHIYELSEFKSDLMESKLAIEEVFEAAGNCYAVVTSLN